MGPRPQPQYTPTEDPRALGRGPVKFRRSLVILVLALGLGGLAYIVLDTDDATDRPPAEAPPSQMKAPLSGVVTDLPAQYKDIPAEPPPAPPVVPAPEPAPAPPPPVAQKPPPPPPPAPKPQPAPQVRHAPPPEKPKRWLVANAQAHKAPFPKPKDDPQKEAEAGLLKPAKWVTPAQPELVLYPEQVIPALMMQRFNSDTPGTLRLMVSQDVVDVQTGNTVLIPQFSTITGKWDERPKYGDNRAQIKVQFLRLAGSGTLVDLTGGTVGGRDGANGLESDVNNHWPEVILGAGLSALLSIGTRAPFGDVEGYYPSLAQQYAQDVGSSLSRTGQRIIDRSLNRPPTLTQRAGYPVTVQLSEAISFQQPPKRSAK